MVMLLPLPWVCQTTPPLPWRVDSSVLAAVTTAIVFFLRIPANASHAQSR
jgi:hypothetical protein